MVSSSIVNVINLPSTMLIDLPFTDLLQAFSPFACPAKTLASMLKLGTVFVVSDDRSKIIAAAVATVSYVKSTIRIIN